MNQAGRKQRSTLISLAAFVPLSFQLHVGAGPCLSRGYLRGADANATDLSLIPFASDICHDNVNSFVLVTTISHLNWGEK